MARVRTRGSRIAVEDMPVPTAPKPAPTPTAPSIATDPYYVRDPRTGLSPAQMEARAAAQEAVTSMQDLGQPAVLVSTPGSAGRVSTPPETGLKPGYEWYAAPRAGGTVEWRQKPTEETLRGAFTTLSTSGNVQTAGGGFDMNAYLAQQAANDRIAREEAARQAAEDKRRAGQSAYNLLLEQFNQFGMGALVQPLQDLIVQGLSAAEMTLRLRDTDAYKKRFAANQQRINRGLRALSEAEYIGLEDQYQNIMRNYGLPASYYTRGEMGRQEGFEKFIANDVSAAELEDRLQIGQNRLNNAPKEVLDALKRFYGSEITNGDALAYVVDTEKALTEIRRKVTAAEIGAGAAMAGLGTTAARAEELGRYGVTGEAARQGFRTVADIAPRGSQLAEIYKQTPYTQATAEQEVFGLGGAAEAGRQRRKLTELEQAAFSGQTGMAGGALARDRAGAF